MISPISWQPLRNFNPRAYVRHDRPPGSPQFDGPFQSTCLREARRGVCRRGNGPPNFNPRAYVRHDMTRTMTIRSAQFQSTCLREARRMCGRTFAAVIPFQSTCLREARHCVVPTCGRSICDFNPRAYVRHDPD